MEHWYIILKKGIAPRDVVTLANLLSMYNLKYTNDYVQIWLAKEEQIRKLCQMLDILEVDFMLTKECKLDR